MSVRGGQTSGKSEPRTAVLSLGAALFFFVAFFVQCVSFARANGQAYDEGITLASGFRILSRGVDDVNLEHPPLAKVIAAFPVWLLASPRLDVESWAARGESSFGLGRDFLYAGGVSHEKLLWLGRAPMIALALLLLALIGLWGYRAWGPGAGLLALALAAFDPNLVAHGSLIGGDVPLALFAAGAFFSASEFCETQRPAWLASAGVCAGLALATKHSGVLVAAITSASLVVRAAESRIQRAWWHSEMAGPSRVRALLHASGNAVLVFGIALLVLRVALGTGGYEPYLTGLRAQLDHQRGGHPAYLLGRFSRTGWISYFPLAIAIKEPPLTLLLLFASLFDSRTAPYRSAVACAAFPLAVLFSSLLWLRVDIGVRYALPLVPMMIVLASRLATLRRPRWLTAVLALGLVHHVTAAVRILPHDLAFFSDVVGGPSQGHRYLSDSNLDWGQDLPGLAAFLESHDKPRRLYLAYFGTALPEAYGVTYQPAPNSCPHAAPFRPAHEPPLRGGRELLAVSAMNAQGVFFDDPRAYAWLEPRHPISDIGHSIAIYDITDDSSAHRALARMYERYGPRQFAEEEWLRADPMSARER